MQKPSSVDELKFRAQLVQELSESYAETLDALKDFSGELKEVKKLWKGGKKPKLMKIGMALIAFPEPTPITEILGLTLLSAGLMQKKIRESGIFLEDIYESFRKTFQDIERFSRL